MRYPEGLYVIEPDRHFRYQCPRFSALIYKCIKIFKPIGFVNLGDLLDASQLTTHLKDPRSHGRFEEDIDAGNAHLDAIESEMPKNSFVDLLEGNHEKRLWKYVCRNANQVLGVVPSWQKFYRLSDRGKCKWRWHDMENWRSLQIGETVIHHGFYFDKNIARSNLDRYCSYGVNFLQGHTHRRQYATNGRYFSASCGHGAIAEKIQHTPTPVDWDQTITFLEYYKGHSALEQDSVVNGVARIRGQLLKG